MNVGECDRDVFKSLSNGNFEYDVVIVSLGSNYRGKRRVVKYNKYIGKFLDLMYKDGTMCFWVGAAKSKRDYIDSRVINKYLERYVGNYCYFIDPAEIVQLRWLSPDLLHFSRYGCNVFSNFVVSEVAGLLKLFCKYWIN